MRILLVLTLSLLPFLESTAQNNISADQLQEDASILWKALNELHPGLYRHSDTSFLQAQFKELHNEFSTPRSEQEALLEISEFVANIKCGHTYVNPYNQPNKIIAKIHGQPSLLPFSFKIIDEKIVVEESLVDEVKAYDIIKCINNIKIQAIIDSLVQYIKADGNRMNKRIKDLEVAMENKYNYFDYYFAMVYGFQDSIQIELENNQTFTIPLMNKKQRSINSPNSAENYDMLWSNSFHDDHAYLRLGTFVTWKLSFDWEEYLDAFFEKLNNTNTSNLIIDIRGNEGGLTDVAHYLTKALANKEGKTVPRRQYLAYKKVSEDLKPYLNTWNKWFYNTAIWTRKYNETYRTPRFTGVKNKIKKNRNAYKGKTILLVDEANSSATFILAENCKLNQYATLVGSETGGTKRGITGGQIFFLTLPNSKIEVDIPLIGGYPENDLPDEGIQPDYNSEVQLKDYVQGIDTQLEFAMKLIQ